MSTIRSAAGQAFDSHVPVLVIGGGACGLTAALKAHDAGAEVVVLEREQTLSGSTAMSSGFIPAAGTRCQRAAGLAELDTAELFKRDIQAKSKNTSEPALVNLAVDSIAPALDWLEECHGLEWVVLDDFLYPGHARYRMHTTPEKTGAALVTRLGNAVEASGIPVLTSALVTELLVDKDVVQGVTLQRPDGGSETIGCQTIVLACNGYGGNRDLVRQHIPPMADAPYYGHAGNMGDAILWGAALGADARHLSGCQGHGSLAHPHGILITWALMMEGGFQVNVEGRRFSNEHSGYSEQSIPVLQQTESTAWNIFDQRLYDFAQGFPDFVEACKVGAVRSADSITTLADEIGVPLDALSTTFSEVGSFQQGQASDPFGRDFTNKPGLEAPYYAVRVTGALFHTQGGLMIDHEARVLRKDGSALPNLFAGGGAACGVSGPDISGYLSGNGLLTAIAFGAVAGDAAARQALSG
ncbi:MAG: FAD-dependent oxidoreductase [Pseudomonadota bacterium]